MNWQGWLAIAAAVLGTIAIWSMTISRWRFTVVRAEAAVLPRGSATIRVLHISDIHMAPWQRRKQRFITQLIAEKPDLVVNTGDNLGHRNVVSETLHCLEPLLKVNGVFVNGSNDYFAPRFKSPVAYLVKPSTPQQEQPLDTKKLTGAFESKAWRNLNNASTSLEINGVKLAVLGVDDAHLELDDLEALDQTAGLRAKTDMVLGVTHAPYRRVIEAMAENDVDILFAGHTHGGQVRFPFIGALTTNSDLPNKNAKGMSAWSFGERVMLLNVCAGLGNSIFAPIRFFNRPEVRVITLVAKG
ncbi:MAG: metallophosphoesterase [Rhodoluna sp.]|nr:metallophosphoesterase [Rhodoluna sp.]